MQEISMVDPLFKTKTWAATAVRSEASENAAVIAEAPAGAVLRVLGLEKDWYKVATDQLQVGYVTVASLPAVLEARDAFLQPSPRSVVNEARLGELFERTRRLADANGADANGQADRLRRLVKRTTREVDLLLASASDFLRGDPNAEERFLSTLNHLVRTLSPPERPKTFSLTPIRGEGPAGRSVPGGFLPPEPPPLREGPWLLLPPLIALLDRAALQAALSQGVEDDGPVLDEGPVLDVAWSYLWTIARLADRGAPLELINAAAGEASSGSPAASRRFAEVFDLVTSGEGGPALRRTPALPASDRLPSPRTAGSDPAEGPRTPTSVDFPWPFELGPAIAFDLCALVRWGESDRGARCFCRGSYRVDDIANCEPGHELDFGGAPRSREGCVGDCVEIRGAGFGGDRDWGIAGLASEVVFPGGREGVPVDEADGYLSWSDDRVQVRVPAGARPGRGRILLRILCRGTDVSECGVQLRIPRGDRRFEVVAAPRIAEFSVDGVSAVGATAPRVDAEACTDLPLRARVLGAERAAIRNSAGEVLWERAPGPRRDIDSDLEAPVANLRASDTLTLEAENFCGGVSAAIEVVVTPRLRVAAARSSIDAGESTRLTLRASCPIEPGGGDLTVRLSTSRPDNLRLEAAEVVITAADPEPELSAAAVSPGPATVTARAAGHADGVLDLVVLPVLTSTSRIEGCLNAPVSLEGRGFEAGRTFVRFPATAPVPAEEVSEDGTSLTVRVPDDAGHGSASVVVRDGGDFESRDRVRFEVLNPVKTGLDPEAQVRGGTIGFLGRCFSSDPADNEIEFESKREEDVGTSRARTRTDGTGVLRAAPDGRRIDWSVHPTAVSGPVRVVTRGRRSNNQPMVVLRTPGPFVEVRTVIDDRELARGPLPPRSCGAREVRIAATGSPAEGSFFEATFFSGGARVGPARSFRRAPVSRVLVGGAGISRNCVAGVVLDGAPGSTEVRVTLVNAATGEDFWSQTYPKQSYRRGTPLDVEPRVWFSQDDTVAMVVTAAAAPGSDLQATFVDVLDGRTLEPVRYRLPSELGFPDHYFSSAAIVGAQVIFTAGETDVPRPVDI